MQISAVGPAREPLIVTVARSFVVNVPLRFAFEVANRVEDWPKMNPTCRTVEILESQGYRTRFRFTPRAGRGWTSSHYAHPYGCFSYTERHDPVSPIAAFQYVRIYRELSPRQTEITEEITCQLLAEHGRLEQRAASAINEHAAMVQPMIKAHVERCFAHAAVE